MKKKIISALSAVLMVILALAVIVGCGEEEAKPEAYTVTFKDGEAIVKTVDVEKDTALTAEQIPAGPTHTGQVFDGWFVGETEVEAGYKPTADVTAAAKYHADDETTTYTVTFKDGDTVVKTVTLEENTAITAEEIPAGPIHSGQAFDGWFVGTTKVEAGYKPTADVTAVAQYHAETPTVTHTVTFVYQDDEGREVTFDTKTVNDGALVAEPTTNPEREGFTFRRWDHNGEEYNFSTPVTDNLTLSALFGVYVTFDLNGGTGTTPGGIWANMIGQVTLPGADGFSNGKKVFKGWKDEYQTYSAGATVKFQYSVELLAQWEEPKTGYTVEYFSGVSTGTGITGETPEKTTVTPGESIQLVANPWTREGYQFKGYNIQHEVEETTSAPHGPSKTDKVWKTIEGQEDRQPGYEYTPTEDIRITAHWEYSDITVKYDPNGGSGTIANTKGTYKSAIVLTTETFTAPVGKAFAGWALTQTGPALATTKLGNDIRILFDNVKDSLVLGDDGNYTLTLYAVWDERVAISEIVGVWTCNGKQIIISEETAGDAEGNAEGSIIINNEYVPLYRSTLQPKNQFYGTTKYASGGAGGDVIVTYSHEQITIDSDVYAEKTDIENADKTDFIGKWQRDGTSQVWDIGEDTATLTTGNGDHITANVYTVIDKYLVLEYEQSYATYQLLLTKEGDNLTGYFTAPKKVPQATSFTLDTESGGGGGSETVTKAGYYPESEDTVATFTTGYFTKTTYKLLWFEIEGSKIKFSVSIDGAVQPDGEANFVSQGSGYFTGGTYPEGERTDYSATIEEVQLGFLVYEDGTVYVVDYDSEEILTSNKYVHKDAT